MSNVEHRKEIRRLQDHLEAMEEEDNEILRLEMLVKQKRKLEKEKHVLRKL